MALKQKNRMDNVQVLKLGDYLRVGGESLFAGKTLAEVAEEAAAKLGFNVGTNTVSVLADSLGIHRRRKSPNPNAASRGSNVVVIAKALIALYDEFNLPLPADLNAIVSHRKSGESA